MEYAETKNVRILHTRFKYCDLFTKYHVEIFGVMVRTFACRPVVPGSNPTKVTIVAYIFTEIFEKVTFLVRANSTPIFK